MGHRAEWLRLSSYIRHLLMGETLQRGRALRRLRRGRESKIRVPLSRIAFVPFAFAQLLNDVSQQDLVLAIV